MHERAGFTASGSSLWRGWALAGLLCALGPVAMAQDRSATPAETDTALKVLELGPLGPNHLAQSSGPLCVCDATEL